MQAPRFNSGYTPLHLDEDNDVVHDDERRIVSSAVPLTSGTLGSELPRLRVPTKQDRTNVTSPVVKMMKPAPTSTAPETRKPTTMAGQAQVRQKDKFVPLPDSGSIHRGPSDVGYEVGMTSVSAIEGSGALVHIPPEDMREGSVDVSSLASTSRGRITAYCVAEALNRKTLMMLLKNKYESQAINTYVDVVHLRMNKQLGLQCAADIFFFNYGVFIFWGLDKEQEADLVNEVYKTCHVKPYPAHEVEVDNFQFNFSADEPPNIQNDIFTINKRQATDHQVRLAMSFALAQSAKLTVYEERVMELVGETKDLPVALANEGRVKASSKQVAQFIGKIFLQSSTLNLLSTVLDTPEYFWDVPDSVQSLYERACEYLELPTRIEVLNARLEVLQEMLEMLRNHQNHDHDMRVEWFVIWLLVVDTVLMMTQLLGLFGLLN
ncbi:hypothetical protein CEUSTIGMA_g9984.t1 [Chlamydomonas eustigma]|uniref:DUF155 domain-containing protein n=1 Tax=Chlamydomonas eustigma TaxID=1157962 RepID=A0A250XHL2_9CHLO|nr:hypothetical protein CEUSTIGMA_g9984.t1 [Chlamydomonas eustigma]|eukprot:GAX82558.1 hypothetical protein CEUSTIGMA_g9984.t1 [Chlamydomonas eustigma]